MLHRKDQCDDKGRRKIPLPTKRKCLGCLAIAGGPSKRRRSAPSRVAAQFLSDSLSPTKGKPWLLKNYAVDQNKTSTHPDPLLKMKIGVKINSIACGTKVSHVAKKCKTHINP
jgi:hypothetical protein